MAALRAAHRVDKNSEDGKIALKEAVASTADAIQATSAKSDVILARADQIHDLADGNLSKMRDELARVTGKLDIAMERISGLEKLVAQNDASKRDAAKVADWVAKKPDAMPDNKAG